MCIKNPVNNQPPLSAGRGILEKQMLTALLAHDWDRAFAMDRAFAIAEELERMARDEQVCDGYSRCTVGKNEGGVRG